MGQTYLIVVDANSETDFKYTDFASGQVASLFPVQRGDRVSWIVYSGANQIGFRIDFTKNGSPFKTTSIVFPGGGISQPQTVTNVTSSGMLYSVTLTDLRKDDPQVVPYDAFILRQLELMVLPPPVAITVGVNGQATTINPDPASFASGAMVYWNYAGSESFMIDFSAAGRTPFIDRHTANGPLYEANGKTSAEIVRALHPGENPDFAYTAQVSGYTVANGTLTIS